MVISPHISQTVIYLFSVTLLTFRNAVVLSAMNSGKDRDSKNGGYNNAYRSLSQNENEGDKPVDNLQRAW